MTAFMHFAILFLSLLIQGFFQLAPAVFMIFYHASLSRTSRKKTSSLSLFFILGVEFSTALTFLAVFVATSYLYTFQDFLTNFFPWIMAGILGALSVASFFFYFHTFKKSDTTLFLPRRLAKNLTAKTAHTKTRSDAFALGLISSALEFFFTLPLFTIMSIEALRETTFPDFTIIILSTIVATIPLFIIRAFYGGGLHLADIQRLRAKNKDFFRLAITLGYLLLTFIVISIGITK